MEAAFVITWTQPVPGREQKSLEYAAEAGAFWTQKAREGKCSEPEMFFGETGVGLWMIKGDHDVLAELIETEEVQLLTMKGVLLLRDFTANLYRTGEAAEQFLATFGKALQTLG
ncbi:hypothetical protein AB0C76_39710 [Kitasatospora sp. NPDC048722]|uniref:hypothetical protein n=1 Tax=Kitasatospora sp. NPDC048722 TaxID=3155639 RepID=UPI0033EE9757